MTAKEQTSGDELRTEIRAQFDLLLKDYPLYEIILRETSDDQFRKYVLLKLAVIQRDIERLWQRQG